MAQIPKGRLGKGPKINHYIGTVPSIFQLVYKDSLAKVGSVYSNIREIQIIRSPMILRRSQVAGKKKPAKKQSQTSV